MRQMAAGTRTLGLAERDGLIEHRCRPADVPGGVVARDRRGERVRILATLPERALDAMLAEEPENSRASQCPHVSCCARIPNAASVY